MYSISTYHDYVNSYMVKFLRRLEQIDLNRTALSIKSNYVRHLICVQPVTSRFTSATHKAHTSGKAYALIMQIYNLEAKSSNRDLFSSKISELKSLLKTEIRNQKKAEK